MEVLKIKACQLLMDADTMVNEYMLSDDTKMKSAAFRVRNNAAAFALSQNIGISAKDDSSITFKINDRDIKINSEPLKRIVGDKYDDLVKENFVEEVKEEDHESEETVPANAEDSHADETDKPADDIKIQDNKEEADVTWKAEDENKQEAKPEPVDFNTVTKNSDNSFSTPLDVKINVSRVSLSAEESPDGSVNIQTSKDDEPSVEDGHSKTNAHPQNTDNDEIMDGITNADDEPAVEKPKEKKLGGISIEQKYEGLRGYKLINIKDNDSDPRSKDTFLYDKYSISIPGHKDIMLRIIPITAPDRPGNIKIAAFAETEDSIFYGVSNNEDGLCNLVVDGVSIFAKAYAMDNIFSTAATFPGVKDRTIIKTEVRPAEKNNGLGHIVYHPDDSDWIHFFPMVDDPGSNVMCPSFGAVVRRYGADIMVESIHSDDGQTNVKCENLNVKCSTMWKDGKYVLQTRRLA